jgi:acyl-coenzyme A synthetase/AMP-(fatty) acid ligase
MYTFNTYRSLVQRYRLSRRPNLGAGNFFWHTCAVATDHDRPILFHPDVNGPGWDGADIPGHSLADLRARVLRYAAWYRENGVSEYSRVGVYTRDGLMNFVHHIAITSLGAIAVHANPRMAPAVAADYFRRTQSAVLIGDRELLDACAAAAPADAEPLPDVDVRALDAQASPVREPLPDHPYEHDAADLIMISHSSGTTGRPKAPMFSHGSFFAGKSERLFTFPSLRTDRIVTALPHSHSAGISYIMMATMLGVPTLILDDGSGPMVARAINAFRPTVVIGFPIALADLPIDRLSDDARRTVHTWMGMGDASHERHIRPLLRAGEPGTRYLDGLGSSEMGMVLFSRAYTSEVNAYARAIGRPASVLRGAAALDEHGRAVPTGQAGMLGVRTPSSTPGYWDDPDLTVRSLRHGYWLTGDVVRRDGSGQWFHLDRVPDVIHTARGPVYSLELEEAILLVTEAFDAAVVAVDDPAHPGKSAPAAVLLFKADSGPDPTTLLAACNEALQRRGLSRLRAMVIAGSRDELPVGVTGKVLKRQLRDRHRALLSGPASRGVAIDDGVEAMASVR